VPIGNFASENMPVDILLLLDVSGSMQPHVQRIASAAHQALSVLAEQDRVAIMVFDTSTRLKLPFRSSHSDITAALNHLLRSESFRGGTRITHALLDAASYVQREARPDARRAIVILTDDETQDEENEPHVESALAHASAVLSFLQAPYEQPSMYPGGRRHGTWGSGGGWPGGSRWPGGGGGIGLPGSGPVILGPRGPRGYGGDRSHSAGTAEIARDSGGDTMRVDEASALEDTLARLRQRYALFFHLPEGSASTDQRSVEVALSNTTRLRTQEAEIRYRRVYMAGTTSREHVGPVVSRIQQPAETGPTRDEPAPSKHPRTAVNEDLGPHINTVDIDSDSSSQKSSSPSTGASQSPTQNAQPATHNASDTPQPVRRGGWPRATQQSTSPQ
jgi:hypothetical protein